MALDVSPPPVRLLSWTRSTLGQLTENGPIVRLELWRDDAEREKVSSWHLSDTNADPEEMAQTVIDAARAEAEASLQGGTLRFVALAFDGGSRDHVTRCPFTVQANTAPRAFGTPERHARGEASEYALSALVKGAIETSRVHVERFDSTLSTLARQLDVTSKRLDDATTQNLELVQYLVKIQMEQKRESAEIESITMAARRKDQVIGLALGMAPLMFAQLTGAKGETKEKLVAQGTDPVRASLKEFIRGMTMDQFLEVMQALPPEKQAQLAKIAEVVQADLQADDNALPPEHREQPKEPDK